MGHAKMAGWEQVAADPREQRRTSAHEWAEKRKVQVPTARSWEVLCWRDKRQPSVRMSYYCVTMKRCCVSLRLGRTRREGGISYSTPDADILQEIIFLLTQRVRAGKSTFLVKVKSHRGEPINKRDDTLAEEGRESSDDKLWTNSVRNALRKQAGLAKLQEARAKAAKHWTVGNSKASRNGANSALRTCDLVLFSRESPSHLTCG